MFLEAWQDQAQLRYGTEAVTVTRGMSAAAVADALESLASIGDVWVSGSGTVANPNVELDRSSSIVFPVELTLGQTLLCEGTTTARVYDAKGRQVRTVQASAAIPAVQQGKHEIRFDCEYKGSLSPAVLVTFKTRGEAEEIRGN